MSNTHKKTHTVHEMQAVFDAMRHMLNQHTPKDFHCYLTVGPEVIKVAFFTEIGPSRQSYGDDVEGPTLSEVLAKYQAVDWPKQRQAACRFVKNYAA